FGESVDLPGTIRARLLDPATAYFAGDATPTLLELTRVLRRELGGATSAVDPDELSITVPFDVVETTPVAIDLGASLGPAGEALGLDVDPDARLDLQTTVRFLDDTALPRLVFGVDLTPGLSAADAFFIRADRLVTAVAMHEQDASFAVNAGFLEAQVQD